MRARDAERLIYGEDPPRPCPTYRGWCFGHGTDWHKPYLGWTCGCGQSGPSGDGPLMFSDHRCGIGASLSAVLPPLVLGMALFLVVWVLAR